MKKIKKILMLCFASALALSLAGIAAACADDETEEGAVSALIGRFENSGNMEVTLTDDPDYASLDDGKTYFYTSSVYPLDTVSGETATYYYAQSLRLKRDYTYEYTCTVQLRKVMQTGNTDLAKIEIETEGTFGYASAGGIAYSVALSDPVSGTEKFYGASIVGEGNIYSWKLSTAPDRVSDIAALLAVSGGEYVFDRYTAGRTVNVEKNEQNVLYDDACYSDMLADLAPYYSYSGTEGEETETPDKPDPEPEIPEEGTAPAAVLPYDEDAQSGIALAVAVAETPRMLIRVPASVSAVTIGGAVLTECETEGENKVFSYPFSYAALSDTFTVQAQGKTRSFSPVALLEKLVAAAPAFTGERSQLNGIALQRAAVSILHYAALCGAEVSLDETEAALVYDSLGANIYHSDFGARDNLSLSGTADAGFSWGGVPALVNAGGACLRYTFSVPADSSYTALTATAEVGGRTYECAVEEIGSTSAVRTYAFTAGPFAPLEFTQTVSVCVMDGGKVISGIADYSVNRAAAKADLSEDAGEKALAKALYSLGKTAAWVASLPEIVYEMQPAAVNGYGSCSFSFSEYAYSFSFTGSALSFDASSAALYVGGAIVGDGNAQVSNEYFEASKNGNDFTVTLKGGSIDGIAPANNQPFGTLTIVVAGDSAIENVMIPMWGVTAERASIISPGALVIRGEAGAALTVKGSIRAESLTVEGASVDVETFSSSTGVDAGALTLSGGALNVRYVGVSSTDASGIVAAGDLSLHGKLSVEGFDSGIYLTGDGAQRLEVGAGGALYIAASSYGITGSAPETGGTPVNRQFLFTGGESYIRAGSGVKYADISVGDAVLTVIADSGYTVEGEDASRPVSFRTTSGSQTVGKVTLVNHAYNPWWDVNYTLKARTIDLNGGNVYVFGMCKDGVIVPGQGGSMTVRNCDLTVENGQNLEESYGRGVNAGNGDECITVENSAKVVFKNCDAAISCWGKAADAAGYALLVNNGLIILDGYKLSLEGWELTSWSNNLTVENGGQIRYTNKAEA